MAGFPASGPVSPPSAISPTLVPRCSFPAGKPRNEADESRSSFGLCCRPSPVFPVSRFHCSRTSHRAGAHLSSEQPTPSCVLRRLFRRYHLCLQQALAGACQMPLLGFSKERPSVVRCWRVHSRRDIAAAASDRTVPPPNLVPPPRFSTALTAYASPTLPVCFNVLPTLGFLVFCQPLQLRLTRRSCPSKFSPRPWRSSLALLEWTDASSPPCLQDVHRAPCLLTLHAPVAHLWENVVAVGVSRLFSKSGLVLRPPVSG